MAELNIQFPVDIRQNQNRQSMAYGKFYAVTPPRKTLSTRGLAMHIAEHGSLVTYEVCALVLGQMATCIPELLSQNVAVELDGLGTFYPTIDSEKGYSKLDDIIAAGPNEAVKGVHMRFAPNDTELLGLTSKKLKTKCELVYDCFVRPDFYYKDEENQKGKVLTNVRIPVDKLSDYIANGGTTQPQHIKPNSGD